MSIQAPQKVCGPNVLNCHGQAQCTHRGPCSAGYMLREVTTNYTPQKPCSRREPSTPNLKSNVLDLNCTNELRLLLPETPSTAQIRGVSKQACQPHQAHQKCNPRSTGAALQSPASTRLTPMNFMVASRRASCSFFCSRAPSSSVLDSVTEGGVSSLPSLPFPSLAFSGWGCEHHCASTRARKKPRALLLKHKPLAFFGRVCTHHSKGDSRGHMTCKPTAQTGAATTSCTLRTHLSQQSGSGTQSKHPLMFIQLRILVLPLQATLHRTASGLGFVSDPFQCDCGFRV